LDSHMDHVALQCSVPCMVTIVSPLRKCLVDDDDAGMPLMSVSD
jgi:hypothetical protein